MEQAAQDNAHLTPSEVEDKYEDMLLENVEAFRRARGAKRSELLAQLPSPGQQQQVEMLEVRSPAAGQCILCLSGDFLEPQKLIANLTVPSQTSTT
jgi:hypothetical protein